MIKLVAFDLDDTLYPERDFVLSGFKAVSDYLKDNFGSSKDYFDEFKNLFENGCRTNIFNIGLRNLKIDYDDSLIFKMVEVYRNHAPNINLYEDAAYILSQLKNKYKLALISDGYLSTQKNKIQSLDIEHYFDEIILTDEYGREFWKPNTFPFRKTMQYFCTGGSENVYIGDNPAKDFYAPNLLGWTTVHIQRQHSEYSNIEVKNKIYQPKHKINNLRNIDQLISNQEVK